MQGCGICKQASEINADLGGTMRDKSLSDIVIKMCCTDNNTYNLHLNINHSQT